MPLGVTGNTPDSGSGESWFDPRRGNLVTECPATSSVVGHFVVQTPCCELCCEYTPLTTTLTDFSSPTAWIAVPSRYGLNRETRKDEGTENDFVGAIGEFSPETTTNAVLRHSVASCFPVEAIAIPAAILPTSPPRLESCSAPPPGSSPHPAADTTPTRSACPATRLRLPHR